MTALGLHTFQIRAWRTKASTLPAGHPHRREGARRVLNVAVAGIGLVMAAPVMLVVAVLVKLTSPGPVFYRQVRVGLCTRASHGGNFRRRQDIGGKPFTIYKLRTMRVAKQGEDVDSWASEGDPRITPVGAFLRKTRLDEIPQLFNVLLGDMNVVVPRPEQPGLFQQLRDQVPDYAHRQRVRPGITGHAQVTLQYDTCVDDVRKKVVADLEYIKRQSVAEDLKIMLKTAPVIVFRKSGW